MLNTAEKANAEIKTIKNFKKINLNKAEILSRVSVCISCFILQSAVYNRSVMPFGIPSLLAVSCFGYVFYPAGLCAFAGLMLSQAEFKAGHAFAIILCLICGYIFENKKIKNSKIMALTSSGCALAAALTDTVISGDAGVFFNGLFECLLVFPITILFLNAAECIKSISSRRKIKSQDLTCWLLYISAAEGSLFLYGKYVAGICIAIAVFIQLICSYYADMIYSLLFSIATGLSIYAFSGNFTLLPLLLFSSSICIFFGKSRSQMLLVFAISCAAVGFFTGINTNLYIAFGAVVGAFMFMAVPEKTICGIINYVSDVKTGPSDYVENVKETADEKVKQFSTALRSLAKAFKTNDEPADEYGKKTNRLIDVAAKEMCDNCQMCLYCWKTRSVDTGHAFYEMISQYERKGHININEIPSDFSKYCVKQNKLSKFLEKICSDMKNGEKIDKKIENSKNIISDQLFSAADIFSNLKCDIIFGEKEEKISSDISKKLEDKGFKTKSVVTFLDNAGRLNIRITEGKKKPKQSELLPLINSVSGRSMRRIKQTDAKDGMLAFIENDIFGYKYAYSSCRRDGSEVSGDSYLVYENEYGMLTAAVADGMGSGTQARDESKKAIDILRLFCEAGVQAETASEALNSILFGKNNNEMFTTLDICCINMHSGRGRVIKNGGASAFIIHGRNTEEIKSSSLPVGVLSKAEPEVTGFEVEGGDMIILVTDGITDCIENSSEFLKDILNSGKRTASDICSEMVNRAKEMQNGKCRDDMLAVGMKIYEKV